ncbi:CsbD family protein [Chitinivorax sp. B]|uniref:CsbD family protein n=1 Tax=Chitinivorax sp. B TaxID=2502235 RepID=UPI0010F56EE4|nr:CsbD family protein [Chitinivorax sp. B]
MNWRIVEANWEQFKSIVKEQWGHLTDDHLDMIAGKREILAGKIQEAYGISKDEAEKQIESFKERHEGSDSKRPS